MGKYKTYEKYKPSSVDWLGEIPEHWQVQKLKYSSYLKGRIGWQNLRSDEFTSEGPYLITGMHFKDGSVDWDACYHITQERYDMAPEIHVKEHDILITKDGSIGKLAYIDYLPDLASLNSHLLLIRSTKKQYLPKYLYYLLGSAAFEVYTLNEQKGTTFYGISQHSIANFPAIFPSFEEQKSIARFLDRETARIDTLITKKRQLIDLLQKKRDAIIYQAVTKGIDDQLLISQGVSFDWCWGVSKEWRIVRLKFVADVQTGLTLGKDHKNKIVVSRPYLRVANVQDGFLDLSEITEIEIPPEDVSRYELKAGDVLMTEGGDFDKLGRGYVWEGQIEGCLHQNHVFAVRPHMKYLDSHYLSVIMTSYYGKAYFTSTSQQTTNLATTNSTKLGNFPLPLPSINQQDEILRELDSKLSKLLPTIDKLNEQISCMQKHRSSLITAAVIGKIDVREEVN